MAKLMMTILLIEDHSRFRRCTREYLEFVLPNVQVLEAGGSEQAMSMMKNHTADIVITDFNLPGMNGVEITGDITAKYPGTKVIMLSGHGEEEIVRSAFTAGVLGYVTKHDSSLDLIDCIESVKNGISFVSRSVRFIRANGPSQNIPMHTVH